MTGIGGSLVAILLFSISLFPMVIRSAPKAPITEAVCNARQIGMALFEFETEYGAFPNSVSAKEVKSQTESRLWLTDRTSNDVFTQLIASQIAQSEGMFYAEAKGMKRRPDNVFDTDATVLEHGECAFAFVSGLTTTADRDTPIVFGPVIPGTTTLDQKSCEGRAAVLKIDNTVMSLPINFDGKIILPNGLDLLDPRQPFWHGKAPDVKWPK